jgi:hypothetical protein
MSIREIVEFYHLVDLEKYMGILRAEFGSHTHPAQEGSLLIDGLPVYAPKWLQDQVSILGFNKLPLPDSVIQTLVDHPELAPDETLIRWTQEQDLRLECTLGMLRRKTREHPNGSAHAS